MAKKISLSPHSRKLREHSDANSPIFFQAISMPSDPKSAELLAIADKHLGLIAQYSPYRNFTGVKDRKQFTKLIAADPAFSSFGFADERYIVARIGGNLITSLHRKIGDMYQEMFWYLLGCRFDLSADDLSFNVEVAIGNRTQTRSTDGLLPQRFISGLTLPLPPGWKRGIRGVAFEVRSCYQIGDSKRIQADWDMALALTAKKIRPVMLIFCSTSLRSPVVRLRGSWNLFEGEATFKFLKSLTGFDLLSFMKTNEARLRAPILAALAKL